MKLKRKIGRAKVHIRRYKEHREAAKVKKLTLQRNKDLRQAALLAKRAKAQQDAIEASKKRQRAEAPIKAARKAKVEKAEKQAKKAMNELVKAFKGIQSYANKRKM